MLEFITEYLLGYFAIGLCAAMYYSDAMEAWLLKRKSSRSVILLCLLLSVFIWPIVVLVYFLKK